MLTKTIFYCWFIAAFSLPQEIFSQHEHSSPALSIVSGVEPQPLLAQAIRLNDALTFLGSSLSEEDENHLKKLQNMPLTDETPIAIQAILDRYCLFMVDINPEGRVKVLRGPAEAKLTQHGWTSFLVKVKNDATATSRLEVASRNAQPSAFTTTFVPSGSTPADHNLNHGLVADRFLELLIYHKRPMLPNLSGLKLEYAILQVYCKDAGKREAEIGFNIGQGTQDIGFRNSIPVLFDARKAVRVKLRVQDDNGSPAMASFIISDGIDHYPSDSLKPEWLLDGDTSKKKPESYAVWYLTNFMGINYPARLKAVYPLPSRRVAAYDEYPDFFFQPQVYRSDGEYINLAPGRYTVRFTRGPEYIVQQQQIEIPANKDSVELHFKLKRWVDLSSLGWHSADHHVHAAGCSHYESPEEGVRPEDMWRQIAGEDLDVASVLSWGPGWYHQKDFFTGSTSPLSSSKNLLRYDVEVSGFPSQHAGHIVLLRLKEDDYPNTTKIEDWPSWTLPILDWAKKQGAITGYAHSGFGLQPIQPTNDLPNYITPKMDFIGANEYIVTVAHGLVDFYSLGNTPVPWELNMWYHTLNCGFRPRLSGETDFPCIFDERVGMARSYFRSNGPLTFDNYIQAIKNGRSYVSDGMSHIIDFTVNGNECGVNNSEIKLTTEQKVLIKARVTAFLPEQQDSEASILAALPPTDPPYWHLEKARIGKTRKVPVELLVNGYPVDTLEIVADGKWKDLEFTYTVKNSSWIALRILPSSHSNPFFVMVNGKPIRIKQSAEWCSKAVDQCWKMKQENIRPQERVAAEAAYNKARDIYANNIQESSQASNK